jgi:hypothetical protein
MGLIPMASQKGHVFPSFAQIPCSAYASLIVIAANWLSRSSMYSGAARNDNLGRVVQGPEKLWQFVNF